MAPIPSHVERPSIAPADPSNCLSFYNILLPLVCATLGVQVLQLHGGDGGGWLSKLAAQRNGEVAATV